MSPRRPRGSPRRRQLGAGFVDRIDLGDGTEIRLFAGEHPFPGLRFQFVAIDSDGNEHARGGFPIPDHLIGRFEQITRYGRWRRGVDSRGRRRQAPRPTPRQQRGQP